jgi:three-Cys-motif partner protein
MTLPDDSPEKWKYSQHTQVKHSILDKYLKTWISIRGSNSKKLAYIDGFAGKGSYNDGSPGSPIIAMIDGQSQIDNIHRGPGGLEKFLCFFIEKNEKNYRDLETIVKEKAPFCKDVDYELRLGLFEETAKEFIEFSKESPTIPMLFFIDPFGWDGVPFDIIKGILDNPQTEILFTFMIRDMNRFLDSEPHQNSLKSIFGGSSYESCVNSENRVEGLLNQYTTLLREQTGAKYILPFMMSDSDTRRAIYYLIFASHHPLGLRKMKEVMKGESSGGFGYLGPDHEQLRAQQRLDVVLDQMRIDWIAKRYKGRQINFETFLGEVCPMFEDKIVGGLVDGDFRKLIRRMYKEGQVNIQNINAKSKAIENKTILTF